MQQKFWLWKKIYFKFVRFKEKLDCDTFMATCGADKAAGLHIRKVSVMIASTNGNDFRSARVGGRLPKTCTINFF